MSVFHDCATLDDEWSAECFKHPSSRASTAQSWLCLLWSYLGFGGVGLDLGLCKSKSRARRAFFPHTDSSNMGGGQIAASHARAREGCCKRAVVATQLNVGVLVWIAARRKQRSAKKTPLTPPLDLGVHSAPAYSWARHGSG